MRGSQFGETLLALTFAVLVLALTSPAQGAPLLEPSSESVFRDLRDDYVTTWYIFNDAATNGILDPGDSMVCAFENWWTTVSAHTQHNYDRRTQSVGQDWSSAPLNLASHTDPMQNFWLDRPDNTLGFYMTYSQFDNNNWMGGYTYGTSGTVLDIIKARNEQRNGYALGWLTDDINNSQDKVTEVGQMKMDIFVHNGNMQIAVDSWGGAISYSNPQVALSDDISNKAIDNVGASGQWHPLQFDDSLPAGSDTYSWAANQTRLEWNGHDDPDRIQIMNSMEVAEWDPLNSTWSAEAVDPTKTPALIASNEVDHNGNPYVYEDSFRDRCVLHEGATDGGVVAGLSGYDNYNFQANNWGDQQVIRIDVGDLTESTIESIIFWDFGDSTPGAAGTQQTDPVAIMFGIDRTRTMAQGQVYYDGAGRIYFPDNRIYIATVNIPEPAAIVLMLSGMGVLLGRRWRRRQLAA